MFGNCFFPLFSIFKNIFFLFLRLKNLFGNSKWAVWEPKMCRLAWQLLGMFGNVLGLLGMLRNVLGILCNVLCMLATS